MLWCTFWYVWVPLCFYWFVDWDGFCVTEWFMVLWYHGDWNGWRSTTWVLISSLCVFVCAVLVSDPDRVCDSSHSSLWHAPHACALPHSKKPPSEAQIQKMVSCNHKQCFSNDQCGYLSILSNPLFLPPDIFSKCWIFCKDLQLVLFMPTPRHLDFYLRQLQRLKSKSVPSPLCFTDEPNICATPVLAGWASVGSHNAEKKPHFFIFFSLLDLNVFSFI